MTAVSRQCRTCRHFAPAPIAGKGWCRNPILYAETQQHLVSAGDLDCERPFGDFWETDADSEAPATEPAMASVRPSLGQWVVDLMPGLARLRLSWLVTAAVVVGLAAVLVPRLEAWWSPPPSTPATPTLVIPVVAMLPTAAPTADVLAPTLAAPTLTLPVSTPVRTATATPAPATPVPVAVLAPPTVAPALVERPSPTPAPRPAPPPVKPPKPTLVAAPKPTVVVAPKPTFKPGMKAIVATGDEAVRLRLRQAPGLTSPITARIENGEAVKILAGPRQSDSETWWQIDYGGKRGWVAGAYLQPLAGG